ncbi:MAG: outer membrane protein assembly factor BamE domain-containing protein [Burkholderiaceae bacterium]
MNPFLRRAVALLPALALAACATWGPDAVHPGETEADVIARLGPPTARYADGADHLLEYRHGRFGQTTWMARIGPDGRLVSYDQVLTLEHFADIRVGKDNKQDVLRKIGAPSEKTVYGFPGLETWNYPYKERDVWDSLMSIYFDRNGVVAGMENGPDPLLDPALRTWD